MKAVKRDERLSPMTYKKLREIGYDENSWKDLDQEEANKIVRNESHNEPEKSIDIKKKKNEYGKMNLGDLNDLARNQHPSLNGALKRYINRGREINEGIRNNNLSEEDKEIVKIIIDNMKPLPQKLQLFRTTDIEIYPDLKVGEKVSFDENLLLNCSTENLVIPENEGKVKERLNLLVDKGVKCAIPNNSFELEVILNGSSVYGTFIGTEEIDSEKFKVIKISNKNKEIKDYNFVKKPYVEYTDLINKSSESLQSVYSSIHNGSVNVQLINMSPKKYISECARIMGVSEKVLRESREDKKLNKYRADKNITFPIGYIDYILKKQDGLHRAIVAEENNQSVIPVCIIRKDKNMKVKDSSITQEIAKKLKQMNPEYDYGYTSEEIRIYNVPRGTKLQSVKNAVMSVIGSRDVGVQSIDQKGHIITIKIRDGDIMKSFKVTVGDKVFKIKAKDFNEAKNKVKDDASYEWMRRLSNDDFSFINGGYGMKFKNIDKYNNAKRIAKEVGYKGGHWYDDKLEYFDYGSTVIRNEDAVKDSDYYQVSYIKNNINMVNLVKANSEDEAKTKFINYNKKKGREVEVVAVKKANEIDVENAKRKGMPTIDKKIADKKWETVFTVYAKKPVNEAYSKQLLKEVTKNSVFKVVPMSGKSLLFKMSNGEQYSTQVYGDGSVGSEVKINKLVDENKVEDAAFSKKSKQGWEIVAMYQESGGRKYAIIKKPDRWFESGFGYVVALGYDENDGQWAQGVYDFATFDKAKNYLFSKYRVSKVFDEEPKLTTEVKDAVNLEKLADLINNTINEAEKSGNISKSGSYASAENSYISVSVSNSSDVQKIKNIIQSIINANSEAKNKLDISTSSHEVFIEKMRDSKIKDANVDAEHIANYMWTLPREVRTIMWNIIDDIAGKYKNKNEFGKALANEGHKQLNNILKQVAVYHDKLKKEAYSNVDLFVKDVLNRDDISWDKILKNI